MTKQVPKEKAFVLDRGILFLQRLIDDGFKFDISKQDKEMLQIYTEPQRENITEDALEIEIKTDLDGFAPKVTSTGSLR